MCANVLPQNTFLFWLVSALLAKLEEELGRYSAPDTLLVYLESKWKRKYKQIKYDKQCITDNHRIYDIQRPPPPPKKWNFRN